MSLDRFLTLYIFKYIFKVRPAIKGVRIPIIMYHSISNEPETGHPYYWLNTSPKRFYEHMKFLRDNSYKVISLSEAVKIISNTPELNNTNKLKQLNESKQPDQPKYVVLTFDDGYLDFYTNAFPILQNFKFQAIVFLPTAFIGKGKPGLKGKIHLNWNQIRELQKQDIDFGSHTINHRQLYQVPIREIELELRKSKEIIEEKINMPVESFCYPFWFPEQNIDFINYFKDLLKKAGYLYGTGTRIGSIHVPSEIMILKRIPVNSYDNIHFFMEKISGNYDWIHNIQLLYKKFKLRKKSITF